MKLAIKCWTAHPSLTKKILESGDLEAPVIPLGYTRSIITIETDDYIANSTIKIANFGVIFYTFVMGLYNQKHPHELPIFVRETTLRDLHIRMI